MVFVAKGLAPDKTNQKKRVSPKKVTDVYF